MIAPFPLNTKEQITDIINEIGRDVTFYTVYYYTDCPNCSLDPITETSVDSFCPTCSGEYWIPTYSGWTVTSHVTWGRADDKSWETGGMIDNGECSVKFVASGMYQDMIEDTKYVVVDGRIMDIVKVIPRGVPDINRIIVLLKEREV